MRRNNFLIFLLLLSASLTVILRFVLYKYGEGFPSGAVTAMQIVSFVCALLLIVCALLFVRENKKAEREAENENKEKKI